MSAVALSLPVMPVRVFYSWQSDLPSRENRSFIQSALQKASKSLTTPSASIELQLAARNEPGSPDIARTIFERISRSDIFLADISLVGRGDKPNERPLSNPNVLIETGYAAAVLGWERVVLVHNVITGNIESLPFDVRGRVIIPYDIARDASDEQRRDKKKELAGKLEVALRGVLQHGRRFRGATWVSDAEREYRLSAARSDLAEYERICQEWESALNFAGMDAELSLPIEVPEVANLRRCLDVGHCEMDIEDGSFLGVFLRQVESFNRIVARIPIGSHDSVAPTLRALRISAGTVREQTPRVQGIIAHALSHDRSSGCRAPLAAGERPYTLDDELRSALELGRVGEAAGERSS